MPNQLVEILSTIDEDLFNSCELNELLALMAVAEGRDGGKADEIGPATLTVDDGVLSSPGTVTGKGWKRRTPLTRGINWTYNTLEISTRKRQTITS